MMAARQKELRVLSGLHEGARTPAGDGATIGSDPARDIVLADPGVAANAATLRLEQDGWGLQDESGAPARRWAYNEPGQAGPVWLCVSDQDDPWPAAPPAGATGIAGASGADAAHGVGARRTGAGRAADGGDAGQAGDAGRDGAGAPDGLSMPGPAAEEDPRARWRDERPPRRHGVLLVLGLVAVVLAVAAAIGVAGLSASPPAAGGDDAPTAAEASLGPIAEALQKLGLSSRVHVTLNGRHSAVVSGWVRDGAEQEQLYAAMARISPMPALRISNEEEVAASAMAVLRGFGIGYGVRYLGEGRLAVAGVAADAATRAGALEAVRAQAPALSVEDDGIVLAAEAAQALSRRLRDAGLSHISLRWNRNRLEVFAPALDDEQAARLASLVEDFNRTHFGVASLASRPASTDVADSVPFEIRSVVSGAQPYVVLTDGSKLMPGGSHGRYRLVAIEADRLVFEGPRRAVVAR